MEVIVWMSKKQPNWYADNLSPVFSQDIREKFGFKWADSFSKDTAILNVKLF